MKIHLGQHKIAISNQIDNTIPLAYIDKKYNDYNVQILTSDQYKESNIVYPYKEYNSETIKLFDKYGNELNNDNILKKEQDSIYYMPEVIQSFDPLFFNYNIVCKKNIYYSLARQYNINVLCLDSMNFDLAKRLIKIFADAPNRDLCPPNIFVNGGSKQITDLTTGSYDEKDIIIIESIDGDKYKEYWYPNMFYDAYTIVDKDRKLFINIEEDFGQTMSTDIWKEVSLWESKKDYNIGDYCLSLEGACICTKTHKSFDYNFDKENGCWDLIEISNFEIDINTIIDSNVNVWISCVCDKNNNIINEPSNFKLVNPLIYNEVSISNNGKYYLTNIDDFIPMFDQTNNNYHHLALIKEIKNKGFIIKTPATFIDSITYDNNYESINMFYELLFFIYSNSYLKSRKYSGWVCDNLPDFIYTKNGISQKAQFSSDLSVSKIFNMHDKLEFADIKIDNDNVIFTGIKNNYLTFEKKKDNTLSDPIKPNGATSLFTKKNTIVYYYDYAYEIHNDIKNSISYEIVENEIIFTINKFKYSSLGINNNDIKKIAISLGNNIFEANSSVKFVVCFKDDIKILNKEYMDNSYTPIAEILITRTSNNENIFDMRVLGGGLKETEPDNFNLIDIGHFIGRPIRSTGSVIIELPKNLEQYDNLIRNVIYKHKSGEEYPIFIYK